MDILFVVLLTLQTAAVPWPACSAPWQGPVGPSFADTLARQFAPALSFAPGEGLFPTVPFSTALDGDGSNGDPAKADLADPWEIAPYLRRPGSQLPADSSVALNSLPVSWKELLNAYQPDSGAGHPIGRTGYALDYALHRVVVLYRVCSLSRNQNKNLERYLRSDEQAFERFQQIRTFDVILKKPSPDAIAEFDVIQYFLYYLADRGLAGHPNDIELVSVFLPKAKDLREKFRIVVGSGHSTRTPNNVLVLSAAHRGESRLQDTLHVLIELGGHSSIRICARSGGLFQASTPTGMRTTSGARAMPQAASGIGYIGQYRPAMLFDRGFDPTASTCIPEIYDW